MGYILRRILGAAGVVVVISMITFAIFFLMPRLAGATPESMAVRYVGKSADPATIAATVEKLGFNDPIHKQYWDWISGVVAGKTIDTGASEVECPAPCLGYSYRTYAPIMP
ncbi:MAG TPA: ABC transporter permease, partial [Marmoricola sp.]|nr:ABC transporter permease [Marmoricola sp.]